MAHIVPPLDADFFEQVQRLERPEHRPIGQKLLAQMGSQFGFPNPLSLESVYVRCEFLNQVESLLLPGSPPLPAADRSILNYLRQSIVAVLVETTGGHACEYHHALATVLGPGDAVVSFNYDLLMDRALGSANNYWWDPRVAYGIQADVTNLNGFMGEPAGWDRLGDKSVSLFKMHGSLHWVTSPDKSGLIRLDPNYADLTTTPGRLFVPPAWTKPQLKDMPFQSIWTQALDRVSRARGILFIGYSFPQTDPYAWALFQRAGQSPDPLEYVAVVDPNPKVADQVYRAFSGRLRGEGRFTRYESFHQFRTQVLQ